MALYNMPKLLKQSSPNNVIDYLLDWLVNLFVYGMDTNYNCLPQSSSLNPKLITSCWPTNSAKVINDIIHIIIIMNGWMDGDVMDGYIQHAKCGL